MKKEIALKLKEMDKKHLEYVNNPKINEDDDLYNERMILLVHENNQVGIYITTLNIIIFIQ